MLCGLVGCSSIEPIHVDCSSKYKECDNIDNSTIFQWSITGSQLCLAYASQSMSSLRDIASSNGNVYPHIAIIVYEKTILLHRNSTVACRVTNVTSEHYGDP